MDHAQLPAIDTARLPETYERAKTALSDCSSIDECKSWADKAAALASYARQSQDDSMRKMAERIQARAIRRAGELLKQIEPQSTANLVQNRGEGDRPSVTRTQAATDAGLSPHQRKNALRVATVPESEFTEMVESDNPPTVTKLAKIGTRRQLIDLKGRDPKEYNTALHFIALFRRHMEKCNDYDMDKTLAILTDNERARLRDIINNIDTIHDQIMTRV